MLQPQNDTNEFVFKRRRKRLQINAQGSGTDVFLDQASDVGRHSGLIPEIAVFPELATSSPAFPEFKFPEARAQNPGASSENIVTVERFLRCSVQTVPKSKQVVPGGISPRKPRAYTRRRPAERRAMSTRKVVKVPKRPKASRIAKTLFRAAVLTDGDPLNTLMDGAGISLTRRPLKFVPFNKFTSPFRFGQTNSPEPSDAGRVTQRLGDISDLKAHHHHSPSSYPRIPLDLVPLQEAEAAYSVMFPSRHALLKRL